MFGVHCHIEDLEGILEIFEKIDIPLFGYLCKNERDRTFPRNKCLKRSGFWMDSTENWNLQTPNTQMVESKRKQ